MVRLHNVASPLRFTSHDTQQSATQPTSETYKLESYKLESYKLESYKLESYKLESYKLGTWRRKGSGELWRECKDGGAPRGMEESDSGGP